MVIDYPYLWSHRLQWSCLIHVVQFDFTSMDSVSHMLVTPLMKNMKRGAHDIDIDFPGP